MLLRITILIVVSSAAIVFWGWLNRDFARPLVTPLANNLIKVLGGDTATRRKLYVISFFCMKMLITVIVLMLLMFALTIAGLAFFADEW